MNIKWTNEEISDYIDEFNDLYKLRPIQDNQGGMKSPHLLNVCFIIKKLKPKYIIESGVWYGQGTWFFEQVSPETKIISIEPVQQRIQYKSPNVEYLSESTDFLNKTWEELPKDDTLLFFDDHQDYFKRVQYANSLGFKKIICEDNYPISQGDCYSPKKVLTRQPYVIDKNGYQKWYENVDNHYDDLTEMMDIYQEMPPIFKDPITRWGDAWTDENYPTPDPLMLNDRKNIKKYSTFYEERQNYTWLCYIELK